MIKTTIAAFVLLFATTASAGQYSAEQWRDDLQTQAIVVLGSVACQRYYPNTYQTSVSPQRAAELAEYAVSKANEDTGISVEAWENWYVPMFEETAKLLKSEFSKPENDAANRVFCDAIAREYPNILSKNKIV